MIVIRLYFCERKVDFLHFFVRNQAWFPKHLRLNLNYKSEPLLTGSTDTATSSQLTFVNQGLGYNRAVRNQSHLCRSRITSSVHHCTVFVSLNLWFQILIFIFDNFRYLGYFCLFDFFWFSYFIVLLLYFGEVWFYLYSKFYL